MGLSLQNDGGRAAPARDRGARAAVSLQARRSRMAQQRHQRLSGVLRGLSCAPASSHDFGHTIPFGQQYHDRMRRIMERVGAESLTIGRAADAAAVAIEAGHDVYINLVVGHIPGTETANDRNGNPALFKHTASDWWTAEEYDAMGPGDVLITQHMNEGVTSAKARGVFVVAVTTPYINNRRAPEGEVMPITGPWEAELMPEDVADCLIESFLPWCVQ
jgi:hypothetical protein